LPFLLPPPLSQAVMPTQAVATKAESRIEVSFGVDIGRPTLAKPSRRENLRPPIGARAVRDIREIARTRPNSSSRAIFSIARRHRLTAALEADASAAIGAHAVGPENRRPRPWPSESRSTQPAPTKPDRRSSSSLI